jgi:hypothetical protein
VPGFVGVYVECDGSRSARSFRGRVYRLVLSEAQDDSKRSMTIILIGPPALQKISGCDSEGSHKHGRPSFVERFQERVTLGLGKMWCKIFAESGREMKNAREAVCGGGWRADKESSVADPYAQCEARSGRGAVRLGALPA